MGDSLGTGQQGEARLEGIRETQVGELPLNTQLPVGEGGFFPGVLWEVLGSWASLIRALQPWCQPPALGQIGANPGRTQRGFLMTPKALP